MDLDYDVEEQETENPRVFPTNFGEEYDEPVDEAMPDYVQFENNYVISIALAETEDDEVVAEFNEIEGNKSFLCVECNKVCKSKGELTRHIKSKYADADSNILFPKTSLPR